MEYKSLTLDMARPSVALSPAFIADVAGSKCSCTAVVPVCTGAGITPDGTEFCDIDVGVIAGSAAAGLERGGTTATAGCEGPAGVSTLASSRYTRTFESVPAAIGFRFCAVSDGNRR